jgi:hypothetical protein
MFFEALDFNYECIQLLQMTALKQKIPGHGVQPFFRTDYFEFVQTFEPDRIQP